MRRLVLAWSLTAALLTGCAAADREGPAVPEEDAAPLIGVALYGVENDYMIRIADAASRYAEGLGIRLELYTGDLDADAQIAQIGTMLERGTDGIVLVPQSAEGSTACVEKAVAAGVPIISVNTRVGHPGLVSRVGSDDVEAGRILMRETAAALGGRGTVAILEGPPGQSAQVDRRAGIREVLQDLPDIRVLSCKTANWSEMEARIVVQKWLDTFGHLDAIIAQSDSMALGAAAVCAERGIEDLVIVGVDGAPGAVEAVREGTMRMTIFQDAEAQMRTALDVILAAVAGEPVEPEYWIPLEVVTRDDVEDFGRRHMTDTPENT